MLYARIHGMEVSLWEKTLEADLRDEVFVCILVAFWLNEDGTLTKSIQKENIRARLQMVNHFFDVA